MRGLDKGVRRERVWVLEEVGGGGLDTQRHMRKKKKKKVEAMCSS